MLLRRVAASVHRHSLEIAMTPPATSHRPGIATR
jgi:hypothetical protein